MAEKRIFVGRKAELEQFEKVLEDPKGQAILVVGQAGMGKTWLINEMVKNAEKHPKLKCGWVRYEVTPTDSVDSTMALIMDNAFEAAQVEAGSFDGTGRQLEQWRAFLNVFGIGDLVMSLRRDPQQNTRDQFLKRLELISGRMKENQRAIFIIDPEKYMQKDSDQAWALVVKELPEKIKLVFAQRPEDVLVDSGQIRGLKNAVRIPDDGLDVLDEKAVDELLEERAKNVSYSITELRNAVSRYERHPYAVSAALELIEDGVPVEELPIDPTPEEIVKKQRSRAFEKGGDAVRLLEAHAVLEVGVPDDVIEAVSGVNSAERKSLLADKYLRGLVREEGAGRRIYHAILADYIVEQIGEAEKKKYHGRAVGVYREKLRKAEEEKSRPDGLAAVRLPEHVLAAEGKKAFVHAFVDDSCRALITVGMLEVAAGLAKRVVETTEANNFEIKDKVYVCQAEILTKQGEPEEALAALEKTKILNNPEVDYLSGKCLAIAGDCWHLLDRYDNAQEKQKQAIEILDNLIDRRQKLGELELRDVCELYVWASERLAQATELPGEMREATAVLDEAERRMTAISKEEMLGPMFWYRRGKIAQLLFDFGLAKGHYDKCNDLAERGNKPEHLAYAKRGLGEVALQQAKSGEELGQAEKILRESKQIFATCHHRGELWIDRFLAEIKRQQAILGMQTRMRRESIVELLEESELEYLQYIKKCQEMPNPNGEGWGWVCLGFLYMHAKYEGLWDAAKREYGYWECLCRAGDMFQQTGSLLGQLEVVIGKGLAYPSGLTCHVEAERDKAKEKGLSRQESLLAELLSQRVEKRPPEGLSEEMLRPRNPA